MLYNQNKVWSRSRVKTQRRIYLDYLTDGLITDHLIKIGDVSKLYGISIDTLRYYDKINLLKPALVTDSGYRYYSSRQFDTIDFIETGKSVNIPLKQMVDIVSKKQFFDYQKLFTTQRDDIQKKIAELQLLEQTTNQLINKVKKIEAYLLQPTKIKDQVFEQKVDIKIYTFSTDALLNIENPFKIHSHPLHVSQWSLLELKDNRLNATAEGISLNNLSKFENQTQLKHLKGTYKSANKLGTYNEIFDFCLALKEQHEFKHIYMRFDFYFASKDIEDYQYFVTIFFE